MPFKIVNEDILKMNTDAIVNAPATTVQMSSKYWESLIDTKEVNALENIIDKLESYKVGDAFITLDSKYYSRHLIHTIGPIWKGGNSKEEKMLYSSYKRSLELALINNIKSIAFPLISYGICGFPKEVAFRVAISAIKDFLLINEMDIYLVLNDKNSRLLNRQLFNEIEEYIDNNYIDGSLRLDSSYIQEDNVYIDADYKIVADKVQYKSRSLDEVISNKEETFSQMLIRLIDQKGMSDVETYKKANIDRRLFSKIRSEQDYKPSKVTAIAFAIALNLNLDETYDLLQRAGYALSPSSKFDIIIEFFIENENYNIYEINEALFSFDQNLLGA